MKTPFTSIYRSTVEHQLTELQSSGLPIIRISLRNAYLIKIPSSTGLKIFYLFYFIKNPYGLFNLS